MCQFVKMFFIYSLEYANMKKIPWDMKLRLGAIQSSKPIFSKPIQNAYNNIYNTT